ncbi:MAG: type II toxin-antitoxin system RelE/ParE family toxin [Roseiarcus sp.]
MFEVRQTKQFRDWLEGLRDPIAVKAIKRRIARVQIGLFGDAKLVGHSVHELRVDFGPGYRVYFVTRDQKLILLLCGGDKSSQARDIANALALADEWTE